MDTPERTASPAENLERFQTRALLAAPPREENQFAITIGRSPEKIYAFWRDLTNLPRFMKDLSDVRILSRTRSRWTIRLKSGVATSWEAEIVRDEPGRSIAWKSLEGSRVKTSGSVYFTNAPAGLGTMVLLSMDLSIPGGRATELFTFFSGEDPKTLVLTNLKRLKAYLETGEIPTTEGQPSGREEEDVRH